MIDIQIPAVKKPNKFGPGDYFILQEVDKDITINLRDWFIQFLPPEKDEDGWVLLMQPRRKIEDGQEETTNSNSGGQAKNILRARKRNG